MMNPFEGKFVVSQTWEQHERNTGRPGSVLGGVDYAGRAGTGDREMRRGTHLQAPSAGVLEWVTPTTTPRPSWYNTGLGYAAAIRRPDGTRTVYGHCSARVGKTGRKVTPGEVIALSGGQKGTAGAGTSTGGHCHTHDVLKDGHTRAKPFSTITAVAGGGVSPSSDPKAGTMSTTFPVKFTDKSTKKATWARRDGLRIVRTTSQALAGRWKAEQGLSHLSAITSNAALYLEDWALQIAAAKADQTALIRSVVTGVTVTATVDAAAVAAELIAAGIPTLDQIEDALEDDFAGIPDAVADEQAERLQG